jgi:hypothetical protein
LDRDTANKKSEGTKTPKEKLKIRRRRTPPPQLPPEERKRFPKPQKEEATRKISKENCSLKRSRDEIQLGGCEIQPRVAKFRKGKCEGDQRHPKKRKIRTKHTKKNEPKKGSSGRRSVQKEG